MANPDAVNSDDFVRANLEIVIPASSVSTEPRPDPVLPIHQSSDAGPLLSIQTVPNSASSSTNTIVPPQQETYTVPQWFLDNCVKTTVTLNGQSTSLSIRSHQGSDRTLPAEVKPTDIYEIDAVVYEALAETRQSRDLRLENHESHFKYDAVYLRYPVKASDCRCIYGISCPYCPPSKTVPNGTNKFLSAVVEQFAKDSGSDMITLTLDDLKDLAEHFARLQGTYDHSTSIGYELIRRYFNRDDRSGVTTVVSGVVDDVCMPDFPFKTITAATVQKSSLQRELEPVIQVTRNPLIIHIPEAQQLVGELGEDVLQKLRAETKRLSEEGCSVVVVLTAPEHVQPTTYEASLLAIAGSRPMKTVITMVPTNTPAQVSLFVAHQKAEKSKVLFNIRNLQCALRAGLKSLHLHAILQPYASWDFLKTNEESARLFENVLETEDINNLVHSISGCCDIDHMRSKILAFVERRKISELWWPIIQKHHEIVPGEATPNKWTRYPPHVREVVDRMEKEPEVYASEKEFLGNLVDPLGISQGWADIELEPRIKGKIVRIMNQLFTPKEPAYGILKNARITGALLYGPPGTGKTQLARIIAREYNTAILSVSSADIQNKYVGETEKRIKALFKLGQMLHPCIIFIDEADSLLSSREMDTHDYSRTRKNQLLAEMDGLYQTDKVPFTLLATNFPNHLDHAVLRRVPSLLHVGLPLEQARKKIFDIYLRDEILHEDVDTTVLAMRTLGYSGSDIKTLCVQAALLCDDVTADKERALRKIKDAHFLEALRSCSATVSRPALDEINAFAGVYDPVAMETSIDAGGYPGNMEGQTLPAAILHSEDID